MDGVSRIPYNEYMGQRVRHALRFAVTTLFSVYLGTIAWELIDVHLFENVPAGASPWATFRFNEQVWRTIALIEAAVVFLLRLGDLNAEPPGWKYAWFAGIWVAMATLAVGLAVEARQWWIAVTVALLAIALWYLTRDRVPGRPGTSEYEITSEHDSDAAAAMAERELR